MRQIISEARGLPITDSAKIVLTGICLGSYGRDQRSAVSLADVVAKWEALRGIVRIRLSSIEARDVSEDLISVIAGSGKLCKHMHIPIQSGDDEILAAMRRKYNRRDYLELIGRIKALIPEISITTDVLVGFPGEGERHFNNTFDLVRSIEPLRTHVFPY
jgi:threonylcarbamoyladenosine tRNA methylthiotransferase MtaB